MSLSNFVMFQLIFVMQLGVLTVLMEQMKALMFVIMKMSVKMADDGGGELRGRGS